MENHFSPKQKLQKPVFDRGNSFLKHHPNESNLLELETRFKVLEIRRDHLSSELQAIENCLSSLKRKIHSDPVYYQLSIRK